MQVPLDDIKAAPNGNQIGENVRIRVKEGELIPFGDGDRCLLRMGTHLNSSARVEKVCRMRGSPLISPFASHECCGVCVCVFNSR